MFIGHFAVGFAAKRIVPRVSLGTLFLSVQLVDLIWPVFLLMGIEQVRIAPGITAVTPLDFFEYPYTHSMTAVLIWSVIFGVIFFLVRRFPKGAIVLAAGVFSHWLLDFVTHRPDLPIAPGIDTFVGLGLWNSLAGTVIVEAGMYSAGIIVYLRTTRAVDRIGKYGLWTLIIFLAVVWVLNIFSEPPDESAIPYAGLALWLLIPWAYWINKHRQTFIH
ncbi:metal-dependent hydrolase [candidate division KSB1 bacterium]